MVKSYAVPTARRRTAAAPESREQAVEEPGLPPLHILTGAPGAGKSTLVPHVRRFPIAAADADELPAPDGSLLGIDITSPQAEPVWPAYNRLWATVTALMLRGSRPVLLMCPLDPDEWSRAAAGIPGLPRPAWALLDCDDADRRTRLHARGWPEDEIQDAVHDAHELRRTVDRTFSTSNTTPSGTAAALARWILTPADPLPGQT